jgi:MoaA/NifB/PqqE/SkfB family radical SAM enzyme
VVIEPTNLCNSTCRLCPNGQGHATRAKGILDWELYRNWIDRYGRWIRTLGLSLWGDPLIAPDLNRMIAYAHLAHIRTCLSTNLHALRPDTEDADALVASGLDELTCSLHGASPHTYEIYQPGMSFTGAVAKIRKLVDARQRLRSATPALYLNFVVTRFNEDEIPAFVKLARDLGCRPRFTAPSLNLRFLPLEGKDGEVAARLRDWLPRNPAYVKEPYRRLLEGRTSQDGATRHACEVLWTHVYITWDGLVLPCSGPTRAEEAFGDLKVENLGQIWNGARYRAARRWATHPADDGVICAHCPGQAL